MEKHILELHDNCISLVGSIQESVEEIDVLVKEIPLDNSYGQANIPHLVSKKKGYKHFEMLNLKTT
jgi:hypothetical protein